MQDKCKAELLDDIMSPTLAQYGKAIDIKAFGPDHPNIAIYRNNLELAWKPKGKYDKATKYYELEWKSLEKANLPINPKQFKNYLSIKNNTDLKISNLILAV